MTTLALHPPLVARKPLVRFWAVAGPILTLLICLPMLQPLRYPAEAFLLDRHFQRTMEMVRQNVAGQFAISDSPPISIRSLTEPSATFALILAGPAWVMTRLGLDFQTDAPRIAYLLIAFCVTLPAALVAGLVYRMARIFELPRPQRAALGLLCTTASGLVSYATTLNPHALAGFLAISAAGCVIVALRSPTPRAGVSWALWSGLCAMLAATLDVAVLPVAIILPIVFLAWRVPWYWRFVAVGLFVAGSIGPLWMHRALHGKPTLSPMAELAAQPPILSPSATTEEMDTGAGPWLAFHGTRFLTATVGSHGVLSHFPLLLVGAAGAIMLMHRHWPEAIKWLAAGTFLAAAIAMTAVVLSRIDFDQAGFATRWFVAISPLMLFWCGVWMRKHHNKPAWSMVALAAAFSVTVGLIGAARPQPPWGYKGYTALSALRELSLPYPMAATVAGEAKAARVN